MAQEGLSLGLGGGPNFFFGSFEEENIGFTGQFDTRYGFNEKIAVTFSYSFNKFQGAKPTNYYSNSNAHNIDLQLNFDVLQLSQVVDQNFPLKLSFVFGGGYSFFDASLHYYDTSRDDEYLKKTYLHPDDKSHAAKFHFGGEIGYSINQSFTIYTNILSHFYFTSAVDAHSRYPSSEGVDGYKETFNDLYFSSTLGLRYNLDINTGGRSSTKRKSNNGFYENHRTGSIFQSFRFNRYSGKKSPKSSFESNKSKQPRSFPGGRWQGKKKNNAPKSTSSSRFQGKKTNGGIPKY